MLEQMRVTIRQHNMLEIGDKIVVAVSGGHDSMSMLHGLLRLRDEFQIQLVAVHLNHQYRGIKADEDADFVKQYAEQIGIKSYIYSENVEHLAEQWKVSFEEAGRRRRYEIFEEVLKKENAQKIAVAQNRNDQAETLLMRFFRGSGLDGLAGIPYVRDQMIIRPLLDVDRSDIEAYCTLNKLMPRLDHTNKETKYTRNKVRLELIPYIESNFNGQVIKRLAETASLMRDDAEFLSVYVQQVYTNHVLASPRGVKIRINDFGALHKSIKRRMIRKIVENMGFDLKDVSMKHIEDCINLALSEKTGKKMVIANKVQMQIVYEWLEFTQVSKVKTEVWEQEVHLEDTNFIEQANAYLKCRTLKRDEVTMGCADKHCVYLDADVVDGHLKIRNRRNGDRWIPLGMKGQKKLKDFFIDAKVERGQRNEIPILCAGEAILWVIGYRIDDRYKVTVKTKRVMILEWNSNTPQSDNR